MGVNGIIGGFTRIMYWVGVRVLPRSRMLSDEELQVLRSLRRISKPKKRLGYMRKILVISRGKR